MKHEDFVSLIGQDVVVDYPFFQEIQRWSMKNFFVDADGTIRHNRITSLNVDVFINNACNHHVGKATHG